MVAEMLLQLYEITFLKGNPVVRSDKELQRHCYVIADQILIMAVCSTVSTTVTGSNYMFLCLARLCRRVC